MNRIRNRRHCRGLTLVESLAAIAPLAVTLGSVLPGLQQARERRHLEGAAAQLATDIRHARSLAVSQAAPVRFKVQQTVDGACYVIHTGHASDCTCNSQGVARCQPGAQALRVAGFGRDMPVRLSSNSASILFDGDRGTVTPTATFSLTLPDGRGLRQIVNIMGRVRACSPAAAVAGYPGC